MPGIPPGVVPGLAAMVSACPTPALTRPGSELSLVLATGCGMFIGGSWEDGSWEDGSWVDGSWEDGSWVDGSWVDGSWVDGSCVSIITSAELPADTGSVPIGCIS